MVWRGVLTSPFLKHEYKTTCTSFFRTANWWDFFFEVEIKANKYKAGNYSIECETNFVMFRYLRSYCNIIYSFFF